MNTNTDNKLITNTEGKNHLSVMQDLINQSDEVWISVAFLKQSGLNGLRHSIQEALKKGTVFKVFCGVDLYISEPSALRELYQWFKKDDRNWLGIMQTDHQVTFHPKIYCFHVPGGNVCVVVGSANLTNGGLCDNIELSIFERTTVTSELYGQIKAFFESCQNRAIEASELNISQYQRRYEIYKRKINRANKEAAVEIRSLKPLKIEKMLTHLADYRQDEEEQQDFDDRIEKYKKARETLDIMLETTISSRVEFLHYYGQLVGSKGQKSLWHSGSLFRQKNYVADQYELFIEMLEKVKDNIGQPPQTVFAIGLEYKKRIKGLGVNVLTEIMNTHSPEKFAVLNDNPVTTLEYLGFAEFPRPGNFRPENYAEYIGLLEEVKSLCQFDDIGQVDHFFNYIYWKYARRH